MKTELTAAFLVKMAPHTIQRHAGSSEAQVYLHHDGCHLGPEPHLHHLMTVRELKALNQKVCHLDMCKYILHFPALDFSILIAMARMACGKKQFIPDLLTNEGPSTG
jgi:hypothetical protein